MESKGPDTMLPFCMCRWSESAHFSHVWRHFFTWHGPNNHFQGERSDSLQYIDKTTGKSSDELRFFLPGKLEEATCMLTHISLASHKRDIGKQCRPGSDAAECGISSGSILFALSSETSIKHGNNINKPDTPYIGNKPIQRVDVEESTRHKWVNM